MLHRVDHSSYLHPMLPRRTHLASRGSLRKPIGALLCDIYGTLLISGSGDVGLADTPSGSHAALDRLLRTYGLAISTAELVKRLQDAVGAKHAQAHSRGLQFPEVVIETVWMEILPLQGLEAARQFALEYELITNPVWPMPGLRRLLAACRQSGTRLGIISNAQFYTPLLFEWLLGKDLRDLGFDPGLVIFSFAHGCAKPCAELFDLAQQRLEANGVPPEQTAFIGNDVRNDIAPAARQGFQTILFAGDSRSLRLRENEADTLVTPDRVITDLTQLIADLT